MIVHRISVRKKMIFLDLLRLHSHIDIFFVYSTWQGDFIRTRWRQPTQKVLYTPFMVDACFFSSEQVPINSLSTALDVDGNHLPVISSAGLEYRDYPTLIEAVRELPVVAVLAAASPWSKRHDTTTDAQLPKNVIVRRFTQYELRQLYAASQFVVMPLYPVDYQAGVTAILEAMAMSKAVICTRTPGQTDVIVDGENGLYVDPSDPDSMRFAIQWLLDHPQEADRMGRSGRRLVEQEMSLGKYVPRLARLIDSITPNGNIQ
jgi:glycosyltransferase involved in cell wall biosynthesis